MSQQWGYLQWAKKILGGGWWMLLSWLLWWLYGGKHVQCVECQLYLSEPVNMECVALTALNPDTLFYGVGGEIEGRSWMTGNHGQPCVALPPHFIPQGGISLHRSESQQESDLAHSHWFQEGAYISCSSESPFSPLWNLLLISLISASLISTTPIPLLDSHFTLPHFVLVMEGKLLLVSAILFAVSGPLFLLLLSAPFLPFNFSFPLPMQYPYVAYYLS